MKLTILMSVAFISATTLANADTSPVCPRIPEGGSVRRGPTLNYFDDIAAGAYTLKRKPSVNRIDQYEIILNYQFQPYNPSITAFVSDCFQKMSPYLLGPNGEQITLRLPNASDTNLPPAHGVTVSEACGSRGEALCWTPKYTCPTILHETMHHLGLVDQYHEGFLGSMGCRSIGPEDSLMANPGNASQAVYPKFKTEIFRCDWLKGDDLSQCTHALDLIQSGMSYVSAKEISHYKVKFQNGEILTLYQEAESELKVFRERQVLNPGLWPDYNDGFDEYGLTIKDTSYETYMAALQKYSTPVRTSPTSLVSLKMVPGEKKSILYPAESSTLLYGNCAANQTFLSCEHGAYDSHFCGGKPAACPRGVQSDEWLKFPAGVIP